MILAVTRMPVSRRWARDAREFCNPLTQANRTATAASETQPAIRSHRRNGQFFTWRVSTEEAARSIGQTAVPLMTLAHPWVAVGNSSAALLSLSCCTCPGLRDRNASVQLTVIDDPVPLPSRAARAAGRLGPFEFGPYSVVSYEVDFPGPLQQMRRGVTGEVRLSVKAPSGDVSSVRFPGPGLYVDLRNGLEGTLDSRPLNVRGARRSMSRSGRRVTFEWDDGTAVLSWADPAVQMRDGNGTVLYRQVGARRMVDADLDSRRASLVALCMIENWADRVRSNPRSRPISERTTDRGQATRSGDIGGRLGDGWPCLLVLEDS